MNAQKFISVFSLFFSMIDKKSLEKWGDRCIYIFINLYICTFYCVNNLLIQIKINFFLLDITLTLKTLTLKILTLKIFFHVIKTLE